MKIFFLILLILVVAVTVALWFWRQSDHTADRAVITGLATLQPAAPERFDLALLEGLPEPAQRYFRYTIQPGTPLYTVARISMNGKFGMGNRESPDYVHMQATQVLAMPVGIRPLCGRGGFLDAGCPAAGARRFLEAGRYKHGQGGCSS